MSKRQCDSCEEHLPAGTEHIKHEDEIFCKGCFESYNVTHYYLGGEYVGACDDIEHIYSWEDEIKRGDDQ